MHDDFPGRRPAVAMISVHGDPLLQLGAEEAGGQNAYVREAARALTRRGLRLDVFTRGREVCRPEVHALDGARVVRLPCGPQGFLSRDVLFPHLPAFVAEMERFVATNGLRYDVLHTNYWLSGWVGMALAARWRVPQVHTHHSLGAVKAAATGTKLACEFERLSTEAALSQGCAATIATSPQDVASLARHYDVLARSAIIPCGVDGEVFRPGDRAAARRSLAVALDRPALLYAGRFHPAKGIDTFVRAAAELAPRHRPQLLLAGGFDAAAGDQAEYERIVGLVEALGLGEHVRWLGRLAAPELADAYRAADVVVVPSHYESFGLVAAEAAACGTPVVASDVGGLRYVVAHRETGLLAQPRDAAAFAEAIDMLLGDAALRERMGQAGARLAAAVFSWDAVAGQLEALYERVAARQVPLPA